MNILHLITSLKIGGAESCLVNFLSACNPADKHTVVYFHHGPNVERIERLGIKTYQLTGFASLYAPRAVVQLYLLMREIKPDLIHSSLWSANLLARMMATLFRVPLLSDLHSDCQHHGALRNLLDRMTCRMADRYVAVSSGVKQSYCTVMKKELPITVITNGINRSALYQDEERGHLLAGELDLDPSAFIVGAVGRLVKIKQYDHLIAAFAQCVKAPSIGASKPWQLVIVGEGPERELLEQCAIDHGVKDQVCFTGARTDVSRFYSLFDCFVQSSLSEGMSIALLEALAAGLPLIATSDDGSHEVIEPGVNGFVVRPDDEQGLVAALTRLKEEPLLVNSMQIENTRKAEDRFSLESMVNRYEQCYYELAGNNSSGSMKRHGDFSK